ANPLAGYPHAEFADSFHQGAPIWIAVDPAAHGQATRREVDIYIVASRDAAAWAADPQLVDVRGRAQAATFPGGSIADNRVALDGAEDLGPAPGDRFVAVSYDVVIDVDRDGELSGGDLIDGAGDRAGLYVVRDLSQPGDFPVGSPHDYAVTF